MKNKSADSSAVSFTLIELMVVMAIVSVLVALMAPALKAAKDSAKSVGCMSNLKQLVLAVNLYGEDYKFYPPCYDGWTSNSAPWWFSVRANIKPDIVAVVDWSGSNFSPVLHCPASQFPFQVDGSVSYSGHPRVMHDRHIGGATPDVATPYPFTERTAEVILLGDACQVGGALKGMAFTELTTPFEFDDDYDPATADNIISPGNDVDAPPARSLRFRHNGSANVAFVDGHVAPVKKNELRARNCSITPWTGAMTNW